MRAAASRLAAAGCTSPLLDAEVLLAATLRVDRVALYADPDRAPTDDEARRFETAITRRERREPVAYILGRKPFRHIDLHVDSRALIPRPETELLVEVALDLPHAARVLDVGTGSGAVALALKHERPDLHITATDASQDALDVARANAARLKLDVHFATGDLLDVAVSGHPHAVLANLPYIPDADLDTLQPEITRHEPRAALAGGPDGLTPIRRLIDQANAIPWLALEVGAGQASHVEKLLTGAGFATIERHRDLAGIERVVVGER